MHRIMMTTGLVLLLAGCAGQARNDAFVRPADRAECQVAAAKARAPQGHSQSLAYSNCHPGERLEWSSQRDSAIRPDFSGKRDD